MSRVMLIEVADVAAEDALQYVLALAEDAPHARITDEGAARAVGALHAHIRGIKVLYSAPVGKP